MNRRRAFLWTLVISLATAALLAIIVLLWPGRLGDLAGRIICTSLVVSAASLACLVYTLVIDRARCVAAMRVSIVAAVAATGVWITLMWAPWPAWPHNDEWLTLWRVGWQLSLIAGWGVIVGLTQLRTVENPLIRRAQQAANALATIVAMFTSYVIWFARDEWWVLQAFITALVLGLWLGWCAVLVRVPLRRPWFHRLRVASIGIATVTALVTIALIWEIIDFDDEIWQRLVGVCSILLACGTVMTMVVAIIDRQVHRTAGATVPQSGRIKVALTCPRCGTSQTLPAGTSRCAACGLHIGIEIEEPRCACGYLLYQLKGDTCPECGKVIPEQDRWAARSTAEKESSPPAADERAKAGID